MLSESTVSLRSIPKISPSETTTNTRSKEPLMASLEICRGQTRFPQRPISTERFLIGSGDRCDLCLGGNDIPVLHSIIRIEEDGLIIDSLARAPELKVNGQVVRSAMLEDSDLIEIGPFEFVLRKEPAEYENSVNAAELSANGLEPIPEDLFDIQEDIDPAELSAAELIELIEKEEAQIDQLEETRLLGADALLQTIHKRSMELNEQSVPQNISELPDEPVFDERAIESFDEIEAETKLHPIEARNIEALHEIERVVSELSLFSLELERRSQRLSEREASYAESTATLIDVQHKLTVQLESLLGQIGVLHNQDKPTGRMRVSA